MRASPTKQTLPARSMIYVQWGRYSYTRQFLSEDTTGEAHRALEHAHLGHGGEPLCMCQPRGVAMHVQRRNGHYNLKRNPNTGHLHASRCESFGGIPDAALDVYESSALKQTKKNGAINLRLSMPLTTITSEPVDFPMHLASHSSRSARGKSNDITLRGYMNLLWESAALHEYYPETESRRGYKAVRERLAQITEDHMVLGGKQRMSERLFMPDVPPPVAYLKTPDGLAAKTEHADAQINDLEAKLTLAATLCQPNETPIVLVLGELLSTRWVGGNTSPEQLGECRLTLKSSGLHHQIRDYAGVIEQIAQSNPGIVASALLPGKEEKLLPPSHRIWMMLGVQLHVTKAGGRFLKLIYGACLLCTDTYIPVESSYELAVGSALVSQARCFRKPLRYEQEKGSRPDFVLLDTQPPCDMEVFGFTGQSYEARARQKIEAARNIGRPLWWWNPNQSNQIPPFPLPNA